MKRKVNLLLLSFFVGFFLSPISVLAGDINGNEQGIINYVSGAVFEYDGKSYVAKEEYISQLRAKLMQDDIDLTQKEANNAIMQINANVKNGVEAGYLREVSKGGEETKEDGPALPEERRQPTQGGAVPTKEGREPTEKGAMQEVSATPTPPEEEQSTWQQKQSGQKIDVNTFMEQVLNQDVETINISVEQSSNQETSAILTVEQYLPGELTVVSEEGKILLKGSLPVKNTGYKQWTKVWFLVGVLYCSAFMAIIRNRKMKENNNETRKEKK